MSKINLVDIRYSDVEISPSYIQIQSKSDFFTKFEYRISIWFLLNFQYQISIWLIFKTPHSEMKFKTCFEYQISIWKIRDIQV